MIGALALAWWTAAAPCEGAKEPLATAAPALVKASPLGARAWRGMGAVDVASALEVDERVLRFSLSSDRPFPVVRLPLALPAPWRGTVELRPRAGADDGADDADDAGFCAPAEVVLFDGALRRARFSGVPVDVAVTVGKRGVASRTLVVPHDALVFSPGAIDAVVGEGAATRLWIGDAPPADDVLLEGGAAGYIASLASLGDDVLEDIRARPSREALRVLFAEAASSWRADLGAWLPRQRIETIARFGDVRAVPPATRPLLRFWQQELSPRKGAAQGLSTGPSTGPSASAAGGEGSARLIVDEAVLALWIDGVEVFDRAKGMPTSIELRPPRAAVRAWIVSKPSGAAREVVHDTRVALRGGEIYAVTATFVQHARGGARRECVRVVGALPEGKDIRWREISNAPSSRPGPMLSEDETYRPGAAAAERALTVVPGGDTQPFPPVPLVYSYTHPGLYKWTLAKDGGLTLELVVDEKLCPAL